MSHPPAILAAFFGIDFLIAAALLSAVSIGAGLLLRRKSTASSLEQMDQPSHQTVRGGFIPVVMGRRRVGSCFLWTGDRLEVEEVVGSVPGGKGFGGGSQDVKQTVYFERGWIALCADRAFKIHGIYKDGRLVENSGFSSPFMPSGSKIDFGKDGAAYIFWGRNHKRSNPALVMLNDITGIQSRWENVCWMWFDRLRLGTVARWGNLEFDIETAPPSGVCGFTAPPAVGEGWNPALCIVILLNEEAPVGCAIPSCRIDFSSFSAVGAAMAQEGLSANILLQDGQTAETVIAGILEDIGAMLYEVDGKIGIRLVRKVTSPIEVDDSVMLPPYEEIDRFHRVTQVDQVVYTYPNLNRDFAGDIVNIEDDGTAETGTKRRQKRVALTIATDEDVAWKIANRRLQENFAPLAKYGIKFIRDFKSMLPGAVVRHNILGDLRLIELKYDATSPTTECLFVQDVYGESPDYTDPDDGGTGGGTVEAPLGDLAFRIFEVPRSELQRQNYTDTLKVYAVLRIRKRPSVTRAVLYRGENTTSLVAVTGTTRRQFGGFLVNPLSSGSDYNEADAIIDIFGTAFDGNTPSDKRKHALDMAGSIPTTGSTSVWSGGIVVILGSQGNEEVCYAKGIEAYATASIDGKDQLTVKYLIRGLIRARSDTKARDHAAGVPVFVFSSANNNQVPLAVNDTTTAELTLYHRSRAVNANGAQISLTASPASNITVEGKWEKAKPVKFMWCGEKVPMPDLGIPATSNPNYKNKTAPFTAMRTLNTYAVGDVSGVVQPRAAICMELTYPSSTYAAGAGSQPYGGSTSGSSTPVPPNELPQDRFVLEVWFVPLEQTGLGTFVRAAPQKIREQTVVNPESTEPSGSGSNAARFMGTVSIDYSSTMHQEDRDAVAALLAENPWYVDRLVRDGDDAAGQFFTPVIGDVAAEDGVTPIFYLRVAHYLVNAPNGVPASVRYYNSYDTGLMHRIGTPIHDANRLTGWHKAEYSFTGGDGGEY